MPRYKLTLEYDGEPFVGWQRQDTGPSVQAALEDAVVRAFLARRTRCTAPGRTDAGVHAPRPGRAYRPRQGQAAPRPCGIGAQLPPQAQSGRRRCAAEAVAADFHAPLLGASGGAIATASSIAARRRALDRGRALGTSACRSMLMPWPMLPPVLVGHHDFNSFRSTSCQAPSPVKTLDLLEVGTRRRRGSDIEVGSRSFLHNQVRILRRHAAAGGSRPMEPRRCRAGAPGRARDRAPRRPRHRRRASASDGGALREARQAQAPVIGTMPSGSGRRSVTGSATAPSSPGAAPNACAQLALSTDRVAARNQ